MGATGIVGSDPTKFGESGGTVTGTLTVTGTADFSAATVSLPFTALNRLHVLGLKDAVPAGLPADTLILRRSTSKTVTPAPRLTSRVKIYDDFERDDTTSGLGVATCGEDWTNNNTHFGISSGKCYKSSGTGPARVFTLMESGATSLEINAYVTTATSVSTTGTDTGFMLRSLGDTASQGGQLYVSLRKIGATNSIRLLHRTDTSGAVTVLAQNTSAGLADATTYLVRIVLSSTSFEIFLDGVSKLTHTLSSEVDTALTGTMVGITFTGNDVGSLIADMYVIDEDVTDPPPVADARFVLHRGSPMYLADTTEEQVSALDNVPHTMHGVEVDARLPSDWATTGKVYLCHDSTIDRTAPNGGTGAVSSLTSAQLDTAGIEDLETYLTAAIAEGYSDILVQHYTTNTVAQLTPIVTILNQFDTTRLVLMTSATAGATPAFQAIRDAGWNGRVGCYGLTAANWATHSANIATYECTIGFVPPGDDGYYTNRAHVATMIAAGLLAGVSTVESPFTIDDALSDGCSYILTDYPYAVLGRTGLTYRWSVWNGSAESFTDALLGVTYD